MDSNPNRDESRMSDSDWMRLALELARRGEGLVEPNPMVGCVIVRDGTLLAEGWHRFFGGPHAERDALSSLCDGVDLSGATWYVTLEPCSHHGKTPPCSGAVVASRPKRVVVAMRDPHPLVNGRGLEELSRAGIEVQVGVLGDAARELVAPFLKKVKTGKPWVIAKWAMTLDGKIATETGDSRWISSAESRRRVHLLRGRVDGIMVGAGTAVADDPRLTARPAGLRSAVRIVVDRHAVLPLDSQLVRTAQEVPVCVFVGPETLREKIDELRSRGVEVVVCQTNQRVPMVQEVLECCGSRGMTNVLVEGGGTLLGALHDAKQIDEAHVYIAPKILGGERAFTPIAGDGFTSMRQADGWNVQSIERIADDVLMVVRRDTLQEH